MTFTHIEFRSRRVLYQTAHVIEKDSALKESKMLYDSLRELTLRMPSIVVKRKLNDTQRVLTAKTRKLKALSAEVHAKQTDAKEMEMNLEVLSRELFEANQKLLRERRENHKLRSELEAIRQH